MYMAQESHSRASAEVLSGFCSRRRRTLMTTWATVVPFVRHAKAFSGAMWIRSGAVTRLLPGYVKNAGVIACRTIQLLTMNNLIPHFAHGVKYMTAHSIDANGST